MGGSIGGLGRKNGGCEGPL